VTGKYFQERRHRPDFSIPLDSSATGVRWLSISPELSLTMSVG